MNNETTMVTDSSLPQTLALNDDTLLEKIDITDKQDSEILSKKIGPFDQCILLAFCMNVKNTNPIHGLTTEEMFSYVNRILENPSNWMVHTMGLLEGDKSRTVERAVLQLQALVDQFKVDEASIQEKMQFLFAILIPPKWEMEVRCIVLVYTTPPVAYIFCIPLNGDLCWIECMLSTIPITTHLWIFDSRFAGYFSYSPYSVFQLVHCELFEVCDIKKGIIVHHVQMCF
jgi:hypothetical protein